MSGAYPFIVCVIENLTICFYKFFYLGSRTDRLDWAASGQGRGMAGYLLPFEIVSVHLVVVLVGAAYLARRKKEARGRARENSAAPVSPLPQPDLP